MAISKSSLSPQRQQLIKEMQRVNFGRIENLMIVDGEPMFGPATRVAREIKFGAENGPRREAKLDDFRLKAQVVELFSFFDELRNGTIELLDVKHGLPFRLIVAEAVA